MPRPIQITPVLVLTVALASCGMNAVPTSPTPELQQERTGGPALSSLAVSSGALKYVKSYSFGTGYTRFRDVTRQSDGRILVVGEGYDAATTSSKAGYFAFVARFTAAGYLDTTFAKTGWRRLNVPVRKKSCYGVLSHVCTSTQATRDGNSPYEFRVGGVALQGDRVLVSGSVRRENTTTMNGIPITGTEYEDAHQQVIESFKLSDGSTDWAFGAQNTGYAMTVMQDDHTQSHINDLAATGTRVFGAGYVNTSPIRGIASVYTAGGVLDKSFSGDGAYGLNVPNANGGVSLGGVTMMNARPLMVGWAKQNGRMRALVARFTEDGLPDPTFGGGDGLKGLEFGAGDSAAYAARYNAASDRIALAGRSVNSSAKWSFAVARLRPDGTPDSAFSGDGLVTTDFGTGDDNATSVLMNDSGQVYAGGYSTRPDGTRDFAIAKYAASGALDTTFGAGGKTTLDLGWKDDLIRSMAFQYDGTLIVVGESGPKGIIGFVTP
ncbi:hypothetical protein [Deinococcus humi]|uniref:Putative delta-60 repeat protein n=1 Tax=Deinococcus humi TaxID=662880 RepID=A0A7W8K0J3_9DEIO|nr:putative delta-60 repeat protein [Deinococcus humi]